MKTKLKFSLKTLQYLSLVRYKALPKIIKKLSHNKIGIILDFEDSSKDILVLRILFLKEECRKGFENLNNLKFSNSKIFIRVNGSKSLHFKKDIGILKKNLNRGFKVYSIFLPKVENYKEILKIENLLNLKKKRIKVVPIIETKRI